MIDTIHVNVENPQTQSVSNLSYLFHASTEKCRPLHTSSRKFTVNDPSNARRRSFKGSDYYMYLHMLIVCPLNKLEEAID